VRLLDHVTVTAPDVKDAMYWYRDALDFRLMAAVADEPDAPDASWFFGIASNNEKSHDLGFIRDFDGVPGRLHHLAFWVETNHDLTEGAKFLIEHGHDLDYGPGQHGIGEQNFLYFRDPAGLRYELNSGGYRNYVPDWEPVVWRFDDGPNNTFRTEVGMPAVHMVPVPPGQVGRSDQTLEGMVAKG
jgi:catechol 2,3-dioxygenase